MFWGLVLAAWLMVGQSTPNPEALPPSDAPQLTQTIDQTALRRCRGSLVGFSNIPLQCTVSEDGSLRQCELMTDNRDVLRLKSRFDCMAAAVRVHDETGAPAVGRSVRFRLNGPDLFSRSSR